MEAERAKNDEQQWGGGGAGERMQFCMRGGQQIEKVKAVSRSSH
jgi:hypothetical protein